MIYFHASISSIEVPLSCQNTDPSLDCGTISALHLKSTSLAKYLYLWLPTLFACPTNVLHFTSSHSLVIDLVVSILLSSG